MHARPGLGEPGLVAAATRPVMRRRPHFLEAAAIVRGLLALSVIGPLAAFVLIAWHDHDRMLDQAEETVAQSVEVLHEHGQKVFETHRLALRLVDLRIAGMTWPEIGASQEVHEFLRELRQQLEQVDSLWLTDAEGKTWASSEHFPMPDVNVADRDYFRALRGGENLYVSATYPGRLTSVPAFHIGQRRTTADGSFDGLVLASVQVGYFQTFYAGVQPVKDRVISLTRVDGVQLVRNPPLPFPVTFSGTSAAMRNIARADRGQFRTIGESDGLERIYGFRKFRDVPVVVTFGLGVHASLAEWRRHLLGYGAIAAAAALALFAFTWLAHRRVMEQVRHQAVLRKANDLLEWEVAERTAALGQSEARLKFVVENSPDNIFIQDRDLRYVWVAAPSPPFGAADVLGRTDFDLLDREEDARTLMEIKRKVIEEGRRMEAEVSLQIGGEARMFEATYEPWRDERNAIAGLIAYVRDVTDRRVAEIERRRFFEQSMDLLAIASSRDGHWKRVNAAFERVLGWSEDELLSLPFRDFIHPDDVARSEEAADRLAAGAPLNGFENRIRCRDGNYRWISWNATAYPAAGVMYCVGRDVTDRRAAEERQRLLMHELSHRVKNTLATVQSIAFQTLRSTESPQEFATMIADRLAALSRTHDLLTENEWEDAPLSALVKGTLAPFMAVGRVTVEGPEVLLAPSAVVALNLALHELATNAAKHGSLSAPEGRLSIRWEIVSAGDARVLAVQWQESGGPPVVPPERRGFGSRLLERGLAHQLHGEVNLDFAPDGLRCTIRLPLPEDMVRGPLATG